MSERRGGFATLCFNGLIQGSLPMAQAPKIDATAARSK
jgi:hypothetical protein